jgi:hypothetical protein
MTKRGPSSKNLVNAPLGSRVSCVLRTWFTHLNADLTATMTVTWLNDQE